MKKLPHSRAPRIARRLLSFLRRYEAEYALGAEMEDEFRIKVKKAGTARASLWYWGQVAYAFPVYMRRCLLSGGIMILNNLKVTFRLMQKHKSYSLINITGLAVGIACCLVVLLFVQEEMSYDRFHLNADRIYRISQDIHRPAGDYHSIRVPSWIGPGLVNNLAEVEDNVRIVRWSGVVSSGDKRFEERLFFADPSFFKVFTFPLRLGNPENALAGPNSVIISRKMAEKYFGKQSPLGRILTVDGRYDFMVSGILAEIPEQSHIKIDFLAPFVHTRHIYGEDRYEKQQVMTYTYLLLNRPVSGISLEKKISGIVSILKGDKYASGRTLSLQALTSIHLNSHTTIELEKSSHIQYTYILTGVAFIILLIACVNYINLSTARASRRAQEVGVRKVIGANRRRLVQQFIGESITYAAIALILALVLAYLFLPLFNSIMDRDLSMNLHEHPRVYLGFIGLTLLIGLAAGTYPAFLLSSFQPVDIVKGKIGKTRLAGLLMRKGLVVFQFSLAIIFIIGMLAVNRQMNFIRGKDLGFKKEQVLILPPPLRLESGYEGFKSELLEIPAILEVTASTGLPGRYAGIPFNFISAEDAGSEPVPLDYTAVDFDYFKFYDIKLIQGRSFSESNPSDSEKSLILNETAVKKLGWASPIGRTLKEERGEISGIVIGVVKDYHNVSLHEHIQPAVFQVSPQMFGQVAVRIAPHRTGDALDSLKKKWAEWAPFNIFYYSHLDQDLENLYQEDLKAGLVLRIASFLSVFIACLGLLGLSVLIAEQRTKEIGIRKTLGASVSGIVRLLCRDFLQLVLISNILAWPVVYYMMGRWLQNFAFHASLSIWIFIAGGVTALVVSMGTVGFQAFRAAAADPVESLRYE